MLIDWGKDMKKKALWVSVIILIIVAIHLSFYVLNNGNPYTKYIADKNVSVYLRKKGHRKRNGRIILCRAEYLINNDYYSRALNGCL